ncbi:MAG: malto-oligosyltrehalose synthase [Verrucomicrobia bacterium]|nr:malto-oligosyltrehalose synthase [Verrucomicrobiota bacterium]
MSPSIQPEAATERIPRATYRLQLNTRFRLRDALALVPYLHELGVSHIYTSPLFKAHPGSAHCYDVCDFSQLNPDLGTEAELAELVAALRSRDMCLVVDIVPNHMGIGGPENAWWWDVLTHGPASRFAGYFDIDWSSPDPRLNAKVLMPVLADRYDRVLQRRELRIHFADGKFTLRYGEHRFPLRPESLASLKVSVQNAGASGEDTEKLLEDLDSNPEALDALVQQQHYRLTFWPHGDSESNYRRFFNVSTLAALRIEDGHVFADMHALLRRWFEAGLVDGVRVDHPDGLRDPEQYLHRLRDLAPHAWIVVEKILQPGETLPATWPVAGTTGYDFLNRVGGLFISTAGEKPLTDFYAEFTREPTSYPAVAHEKKRRVLRELFASEVHRLTTLLLQLADRHWQLHDFTSDELREALCEVAACFGVYRTYAQAETRVVTQIDNARVHAAVAFARQQRPDLDPVLFASLHELLLLHWSGEVEGEFVARFQQLTGPVAGKGIEDTAFYCFNRFVSLNEVGGGPDQFGVSVETFHEVCVEAQAQRPHSMLATSTHDTKRSEDVRARLSLLSEIPDRWCDAVRRWSAMNERHRRDGRPDRNAEYFFYQTLVGAWPLSLDRALAYLGKAVNEASQHTTWTHRDAAYEDAIRAFVTGTLGDPEFTGDLEQFLAPLAAPAQINSLAQTLLKLTAPGVPDIYQGDELWDFSLVDPDNRRPVDFGLRCRLLSGLPSLKAEAAWRRRSEGVPKLFLIQRALNLRRRNPDWFARGNYEPILARGRKADHVVAFSRAGHAVTVVPRLILGVKGDWADTALDLLPGEWRNEFTDEHLRSASVNLAELFQKFPVALLTRKEDG